MRPHVIEHRAPAHHPPLGDIHRHALVKVTQKRRGVLLSIASEEVLGELKKIDAAAAVAAASSSSKKGAKAMASEDQVTYCDRAYAFNPICITPLSFPLPSHAATLSWISPSFHTVSCCLIFQ